MSKTKRKKIILAKKATLAYCNDAIRQLIFLYFYDRNSTATSHKGEKGSHIKIRDICSDLKTRHRFKAGEIIGYINYLHSQGWIDIEVEKESFTNPETGFAFPSEMEFYFITAARIDKIEEPSRFTPKGFEGINIEAVGSVLTIGDGNQINVKFLEAVHALSELRNAVAKSIELNDEAKLEVVTDIDGIQDHLAKPSPDKTEIQVLWENINMALSVAILVDYVTRPPY